MITPEAFDPLSSIIDQESTIAEPADIEFDIEVCSQVHSAFKQFSIPPETQREIITTFVAATEKALTEIDARVTGIAMFNILKMNKLSFQVVFKISASATKQTYFRADFKPDYTIRFPFSSVLMNLKYFPQW